MEALFFKEDRAPAKTLQLRMQNLTCPHWGSSDEQVNQVNQIIQNVHMDYDGVLRCILSLQKAGEEQKYHILVFVIADGNKDYTVMNFPEYLQDQLEYDLDELKKTQLNYDEEISRALNSSEKLIPGAALASLMVNQEFDSSFIIFANNA